MQRSPSALLLIGRGMVRGLTGLRSQRSWGATFGALLGAFFLLQIMLLIFVATEGVQGFLRSQTDLRLEIRDGAGKPEILGFFSEVQQLPYVEKAVYITSEQAYERMKTDDPEIIDILESFQLENPFPETIGITLTSLSEYTAFTKFLRKPEWQGIVDPTFLSQSTDQESHVMELMRITTIAHSITIVLVVIVAFVLLLVITSLTRARAQERRNEVLVEHLVGARPLGILSPFVSEAIVLCLLCALITAVVVGGTLWGGSFLMKDTGLVASLLHFITPALLALAPWFVLAECVGIPCVATIGAWLAMHPQLKKRTLAL